MAELRFDGRVALVTGAGGGLGREYALLLAARGARVVVNDIGAGRGQRGASAEAVAREIREAGGEAAADTHSVADSGEGRAMVEGAVERFGRLDIVVHNAGVGGLSPSFEDLSDEALERMIGTHLLGAFHVLRPAWRIMKEQRYGRVVNIASSMGLGADGSWDYPAAKLGLVGLTRSLAVDGERFGIKANALMPLGYTPMAQGVPNPEVRSWLEANFPARKVAPSVAWLCHEEVPCNGETLTAGGGRTGRVFIGITPGFRGDDPTIEDLRDHWDAILDTSVYHLARQSADDAVLYDPNWKPRSVHAEGEA